MPRRANISANGPLAALGQCAFGGRLGDVDAGRQILPDHILVEGGEQRRADGVQRVRRDADADPVRGQPPERRHFSRQASMIGPTGWRSSMPNSSWIDDAAQAGLDGDRHRHARIGVVADGRDAAGDAFQRAQAGRPEPVVAR